MTSSVTSGGWGVAAACAGLAAAGIFFPAVSIPFAAAGMFLVRRHVRLRNTYPLRIPVYDAGPGGTAGSARGDSAAGTFFTGCEIGSGKEVWLSNSDLQQNILFLGTDGLEKTEALIGAATNALSQGSGFIFVNGNGDRGIYGKLYSLCRRFHREDDLLVLNFFTGGGDFSVSHRINPFRLGSADVLSELLVSLMDDVGGDGAMWKGRASAMMVGIMRPLCWLRDNEGLCLSPGVIRDYTNLRRIVSLTQQDGIPENILRQLKSYLNSLPGFSEERGEKQSQTTLDQHGYLEMQLTKILGSLADVYGHIFREDGGDVDLDDIIRNRRCLLVMLPALEKSGDEISNLGKIIVASLKAMMSASLGTKLLGSWDEVAVNRPTNSKSPAVVILDACCYYMINGFGLMAAQAKSVGIAMVYASQDIPEMKRMNEKEAASIIANTNTRIFMRTEELGQGAKLDIDGSAKVFREESRFQPPVRPGRTGYSDLDDCCDFPGFGLEEPRPSVGGRIPGGKLTLTKLGSLFGGGDRQRPGRRHVANRSEAGVIEVSSQGKLVRTRAFYAGEDSRSARDGREAVSFHRLLSITPGAGDDR